MPQQLKVADVIQANRDNVDKLGAFNDKFNCLLSYGDGCYCAIGVALDLNDPELQNRNDASVGILYHYKLIRTDDLNKLRYIQIFHDSLISYENTFGDLSKHMIGFSNKFQDYVNTRPANAIITKEQYLHMLTLI